MNNKYWVSIVVLAVFSVNAAFAQIIVNSGQTAAVLAQKLTGEGVTVSNAVLHCTPLAEGIFSVVNSNLGLDSGIVLTNGRAATLGAAVGVNGAAALLANNDNLMPGDSMLNHLAGQTTLDACSLEFDVIPQGDTIKFNYIFSSEEYQNAVCSSFNDAFAFFISGSGVSGNENMALVPGTQIPVTINSINDGVVGSLGTISNCTNMGVGSPFTAYYIDNTSGTSLTHKGLTTVLQAIHAVNPCNTYHLKMVIADAGDAYWDSAVFLEAGSLHTSDYSITAHYFTLHDTAAHISIKGCLPGRFTIFRSDKKPQAQTVKFLIEGTAVNGSDYALIPDSVVIPPDSASAEVIINGLPTVTTGMKYVKLLLLPPVQCTGNQIIDSAVVFILDTMSVHILTPDTVICAGQSVQIHVAGSIDYSYSWLPVNGLLNPDVQNAIASPTGDIEYSVTASFPGTSCVAAPKSVHISIKPSPSVILKTDTIVCYNTTFPLNAQLAVPNNYYSYSWSGPNGFTSTLLDPIVVKPVKESTGLYNVTVRDDSNSCTNTFGINVYVTVPDTPIVNSPFFECVNTAPTTLRATGKNILWFSVFDTAGSPTAPTPPTNQIDSFVFYVTQSVNNCESPRSTVTVEVKKCCDGIICIPTAFTPNGDGKNDYFQILDNFGYNISEFRVFDRWGEMVYNNPAGKWDGTFLGQKAEVGTYFYLIKIKCVLGPEITEKGDVMLLR
jgi:gliding motility-associated-like protein